MDSALVLPSLDASSSTDAAAAAAAVADAVAHPFLSHLVALLSIYELSPTLNASNSDGTSTPARTPGIPLPRYDGPHTAQTDSITRSLSSLAMRMRSAEEHLGYSHPWLPPQITTHSHPSDLLKRYDSSDSSASDGTPTKDTYGEKDPFAVAVEAPTPLRSEDGDSPQTRAIRSAIRHARAPSPMQISLDGLQPIRREESIPMRDMENQSQSSRSPSSSNTSVPSPYHCPTCRRPVTKPGTYTGTSGGGFLGSPNGSPLVVPPGPLSAAAFESGMSAVEELRLLKAQVQDVARVCKAVANGDLTQKIEVGVQGPVMVQLKDVINTMVDRLGEFAKEVTRVSLEVGTEGRLGGQAVVVGVQGKWQELTDVVS